MSTSTLRKVFLGLFVVSWLATDILFWVAGLHLWAIMWIVILLTVAIVEIIAKLTGNQRTISTRLGHLITAKPVLGWTIIGTMLLSWILLLAHLGVGR